MATEWTQERVTQLAPDAASLKAGQGLARADDVPETRIGYGRKRSALRDTILCVRSIGFDGHERGL